MEYAFTVVAEELKYRYLPGFGWRGDSHMKRAGMLVVSLRGVNFGF